MRGLLGLSGLPDEAFRPRPWEPWTPLGIFWAIHLLFGTFPQKLFNDHVMQQLGADWLPCSMPRASPSRGATRGSWAAGGP